MKIPTILLLVVLAVVFIFVVANWSAITAPAAITLLVTDVQAPMGLILVAIMGLLTALFLVYVVYLQTSVLLESRRHTRELRAQRELADQAEASRFTELRGVLEARIDKLSERLPESPSDLAARMEALQRALMLAIEQQGNAMAAQIGELDDRLQRDLPRRN